MLPHLLDRARALAPRSVTTFTAACFLACATFDARAQVAAPPAPVRTGQAAELRTLCDAELTEQHIVGMCVAVLDDGEVVLNAAFGQADREERCAATTDTLFRLGSISKPVTAAIALQLVDEKKLDLDADVRTRLPAFAARLQPTTLRQLLSHTAGIRHYAVDKKDNSTEFRTTAQAVELFVGDPLVAPPGTQYSYSTHGYTLVAAVLEQASGKSFVELERASIRARGLATLDCEVLADVKPLRSALYDLDDSKTAKRARDREDNSWKYAGGGMESTALDLARFAELLRTAKLVSEASRDALWTRTKLANGEEIPYGLGWRVAPDRSSVMHTGSQQGAQSALFVSLTDGVVIAVLTNTNGCKPEKLGAQLKQLVAPRATAPAGAK